MTAEQLRLLDLRATRITSSPALTPFLKWPGGKSQELAAIAVAAPVLDGRFIDPFVGGGSILLATPANVPAWANDAAEDLIRLYLAAATEDRRFRRAAGGLAQAWDELATLEDLYSDLADAFLTDSSDQVSAAMARDLPRIQRLLDAAGPDLSNLFASRVARDLPAKFARVRQVEASIGKALTAVDLLANVEGAVRAAVYVSVRARYNHARLAGRWDEFRMADFLFLREFAFAAMFRFNSRGAFNVPYGGLTYNRKSLTDKLALLPRPGMLARLSNTEWRCGDFEPFLAEASPTADDFVFIDPPYDSDFSDYDNLPFGRRDQERLQRVLDGLAARVMVVIKDTPLIRRLYRADRWRVAETRKIYMWTIKSRNDRDATHLTITNY